MKILWHSPAPWCQTGYGRQTATWVPRLAALGHEITISTFAGLTYAPLAWKGFRVLPPLHGDDQVGSNSLAVHYTETGADLAITLMDVWPLNPAPLAKAGMRLAHWMPVDCHPLGAVDEACLRATGATPVAMSRHGLAMLKAAGFSNALYVPHGIDTSVFTPLTGRDRRDLREECGLPRDAFLIGINAANADTVRKGFPEQFAAFALFHAKHPGSLLMVHTLAEVRGGLDLPVLARQAGIADSVVFSPPYQVATGVLDDHWMARWYQCLDILSACSYGEGFGLPIAEAMACAVPVVTTRDEGPMQELVTRDRGWLAESEPYWQHLHQAWWHRPMISAIARCYAKAAAGGITPRRAQACRDYAVTLDADAVQPQWEAVLSALG